MVDLTLHPAAGSGVQHMPPIQQSDDHVDVEQGPHQTPA